jgi:hypothetical protein
MSIPSLPLTKQLSALPLGSPKVASTLVIQTKHFIGRIVVQKERRNFMSFTTKVKATGQYFMATTEITEGQPERDAHELRLGRSYSGHLFRVQTPQEFTDRIRLKTPVEWATFTAEELEPVSVT